MRSPSLAPPSNRNLDSIRDLPHSSLEIAFWLDKCRLDGFPTAPAHPTIPWSSGTSSNHCDIAVPCRNYHAIQAVRRNPSVPSVPADAVRRARPPSATISEDSSLCLECHVATFHDASNRCRPRSPPTRIPDGSRIGSCPSRVSHPRNPDDR